MFKGMTLRKKIAVLMTVSVVLIAVSVWALIYRSEKAKLIENNSVMLSRYLDSFADAAGKDGLSGVKKIVEVWGKIYPEGRITVINTMGDVVLDNKTETKELDNHYKRPEVMEAFASGGASEIRFSKTQDEWLNYMARRVVFPGEPGTSMVIRLSFPIEKLKELGWSMGKSFLYSLELLLLLVWGGAYWLLRSLMRPLNSLSRAAETIAEGGSARFPITDDPEIQTLSNALNSMSDSLKLSVSEARESKEEISLLVEKIPIGIVLIDEKRKIRYINKAAAVLCGYLDALPGRGASIEVVLPCEDMCKQLDKPNGTELVSTLGHNAKKIEMTTLSITKGRLIIMQDLTEKVRLEDARRDFFIDAGHEFQTPLTVIRMGLELLRSSDSELSDEDVKSLNSMIRQQERISGLVDDLMFLVKLDVEPLKKGMGDVDVSELGKDVAAEAEMIPGVEKIDFSCTFPKDCSVIKGRYDDLKRALFNLVENAVKYVNSSREDGGKVDFSIRDRGDAYEIIVDDNGPGVAEGEEESIFDRFRRGDAHRARSGEKTGGYGLGLSIARRIAERHGGTLELAESKLGGAMFRMELPKA